MKPTLLFCVAVFLFLFCHSSQSFCQWIQVSQPLGVYSLAVHGEYVYAGTFDTNGSVWISSDNGSSWTARGDKNFVGVYSLTFLGSNCFAGTYEKGVWRSTDSGKSWMPANTGIAGEDVYGLAAIGSNLVAIGLGGVFQSRDSGATWKSTSDKYALESSATPLAVGRGFVYAATVSGLLRSGDSGATWIRLSDSAFLGVGADDSNLYASNDSGFFRSTDNGASWTNPSSYQFGLLYLSGKYIFGGPSRANDITCYISDDYGATWLDLNQNSRSTSLVVSGPNIIKGSNNTGIWYRPLADVFAGVDKQIQTHDLFLFPNPTSGVITINNAPENIQHITITNLLGESVIELPNPNSPDFSLDLSKLPAGTYFARLALPNQVITRKIFKE